MSAPPAKKRTEAGFATRAIHAGLEPDPATGAVSPPVYQTSTYAQEEIGKHKGYEYARTQNPTRERLERSVAALEGATHGLAFASGMAATSTVLQLLKGGDHVVASDDLYGGTYRLFERLLRGYGLTFTHVDSSSAAALERAVTPETRLLFLETPSNPLMRITDLAHAARLAKAAGAISVVDNTFCSPALQRPLEMGIDVVVHSTTKYLNGHSDVVGGAVATSRDDLAERLRFLQNAVGAVPGPWDCWLALRGIRTLALRMERHDANGRVIAEWLSRHPKVKKLYYPGLPSHPQHELAKRQMQGFGGMVSFDLGSLEAANRFARSLRVFTLAESLGGVESLCCHPATMTHASMPKADREARGLTEGLIRLSVGCEDPQDLLADVEGALEAV
ncbi:MAG TPA: cystathionine gamma-synthase [Candidatus Eisenbacteria bacterium]|nr:cystathionine gamma-synthase [Candidatus Eisenbacteria bacterium]